MSRQQFSIHLVTCKPDSHETLYQEAELLTRVEGAVQVIDFECPYWHTTQDTADKVSAESLARIGTVLEVFLEQE